MLDIFDIKNAYADLSAHFQLICDCFENDENGHQQIDITTDKTALITVKGFGLSLKIEPNLTTDNNDNTELQLIVKKENFDHFERFTEVCRLTLYEHTIAKVKIDGEDYQFNFGSLSSNPFRKPPVIREFLSVILTEALKRN